MSHLKVSVVIPCYNSNPDYLKAAIESVRSNSRPSLEIVIVDDGSTCLELTSFIDSLASDDVKVVRIQNSGPAVARNVGVAASSGNYIMPLDSDDLVCNDYISEAAEILDRNQAVDIVYGEAEYFGAASGRMELKQPTVENMLIENQIFNTAMFRRDLFVSLGGYNEALRHGFEDYELWLRMIGAGAQVYKIPRLVFKYRIHASSRNRDVVEDRSNFVSSRAEIFRNNIDLFAQHPEVVFLQMEQLRDRILWWERNYGPIERLFNSLPFLRSVVKLAMRLFGSLRSSKDRVR